MCLQSQAKLVTQITYDIRHYKIKWWPVWRVTQPISPRESNVALRIRPQVTFLPRGDIGRVAQHARLSFIISHQKSLMGNCIKELFLKVNKSINQLKIYFKHFFSSTYNNIIMLNKLNLFQFLLIVVITFGITSRWFTFMNIPNFLLVVSWR